MTHPFGDYLNDDLFQFLNLLGGSVLGIDSEDLVGILLGQVLVLAIDEGVGHHVVVAVLQHGVLAVVAVSLAFEQVDHLLVVGLCKTLLTGLVKLVVHRGALVSGIGALDGELLSHGLVGIDSLANELRLVSLVGISIL